MGRECLQCGHTGQTEGSILGGMEQDSVRLYHATQNGAQLKIHKWFIPGIFHLIYSDWVTETAESETEDKGVLLY